MGAGEILDPLAISKRIRSRYLLPGERVVVSTRRHWVKLAGPVALAGLTFVLMVWGLFSTAWGDAASILVYLFLAAALFALWRVLEWRTEWFVATDRRLLKTYGLITQKVAMMPLAKVTDMSYDRSLLGRVLGYGEFVMESAGQDQALSKMDLVPRPDPKYVAMCETIFGRDLSDPGEDGPEWGSTGQHDDWDEGEVVRDEAPQWEGVDRDELPDDWAWVDDDPDVDRHTDGRDGAARGPGRDGSGRDGAGRDGSGRDGSGGRRRHLRPVAVDPDPTPWKP